MTSREDSSMISEPMPADMAAPSGPQAANPAALTVEQLARMLGIDPQKVRDHIVGGAPTGPDGRVNLVHYAAWLNKEMGNTDGD